MQTNHNVDVPWHTGYSPNQSSGSPMQNNLRLPETCLYRGSQENIVTSFMLEPETLTTATPGRLRFPRGSLQPTVSLGPDTVNTYKNIWFS